MNDKETHTPLTPGDVPLSAGILAEVEGVLETIYTSHDKCMPDARRELLAVISHAVSEAPRTPIPMVLSCPRCQTQHVDAPEPEKGWTNPPHKSHLCHGCGTVWRPADVATVGVERINTRGDADTWFLPNAGEAVDSPPEPSPRNPEFEELLQALALWIAVAAMCEARLPADIIEWAYERVERDMRSPVEAARAALGLAAPDEEVVGDGVGLANLCPQKIRAMIFDFIYLHEQTGHGGNPCPGERAKLVAFIAHSLGLREGAIESVREWLRHFVEHHESKRPDELGTELVQ